MSTRSPHWQKIIALFALVSVLLGTFEHEDLILQNQAAIPQAAPFATTAAEPALHDSLDATSRESGTQGTFRWEGYRLWLSPKNQPSYEFVYYLAPRNAPPVVPSTGLQLNSRPRLADIVAMRV